MTQPPTMTGCREYMGPRTLYGYGQRWDKDRGGTVLVHRWVWEQINGPIPKGMMIMHLCDNPACFLYAHLRLGTYAENTADAKAKGRLRHGHGPSRSDVCQHGHPITEYPGGRRGCHVCAAARMRRQRERKKNP